MRNNFKRYIRLKVKENIYFIKSDSCLNPSFSFADVEKTLYLDFRKFYLEIYFHYMLYVFYITETFPRKEICQNDGKSEAES